MVADWGANDILVTNRKAGDFSSFTAVVEGCDLLLIKARDNKTQWAVCLVHRLLGVEGMGWGWGELRGLNEP
jgi:hypothetical protein